MPIANHANPAKMNIESRIRPSWWAEHANFFGPFYLLGDDSVGGHLAALPLSLDARTRREVAGVRLLARLQAGERVLDVPCGAGRHAIELAALGYDVLGVDLNGAHLEIARQQASKRNACAVFEQGDMLSLAHDGEFDVVINMFYSFGFFATEEENRRVLSNFRVALKPGGRFLMHTDVNLPRIRSGAYRLTEERRLRAGGVLRIEERLDEASRRIEGSWTIILNGTATRRAYSVRVYEVDEFIDLCTSCGFKKCVAFGNWEGGTYAEESEEVIFVAD